MGDLSARNFGLIVAFLIPGFVLLWAARDLSPVINEWLSGPGVGGPSVGGMLFVTLASLAAGMSVSAIRWAIVDSILHWSVPPPAWRFADLGRKLPAFLALVENHYRFYQFYSNMLVATVLAYALARPGQGRGITWLDTGVFLLVAVYAGASRDALQKYYSRATELLGLPESEVPDDQRIPRPRRRRKRRSVEREEEAGGSTSHPGEESAGSNPAPAPDEGG